MDRKLVSAAAVLAAAIGGSSATAAPISLPAGPVFFQFNNLEQVDTSLNNGITVPGGSIDVDGDGVTDTPTSEGNWGVFNVSSMQEGGIATDHQDISGGSAFFADDGEGDTFGQGQVSGIFYGLTTTSATTATGGWLDIYWEDPADDDITTADLDGVGATPGIRTSANQAGKFTDGEFLARLAFMPGIINGDSSTTLSSTMSLQNITGTGQADSFADVMDINNDGVIDGSDGAWASSLNGDWFYTDVNGNGVFGEDGERRDLRFSNFFNLLASWDDPNNASILGLRSNDPGRVFVVPEPGMLGLLGIALFGMGLTMKRRRRQN